AVQDSIELLRRDQVAPKRFFYNDSSPVGAARFGELFHDQPEYRGRDGEVVRRPLRGAELLADGLERCRVGVITIHVTQQTGELLEGSGVGPAAMLLEAVARTRLQLVEIPAGLGHTDDGHVEIAALEHRLQRRKDLLV